MKKLLNSAMLCIATLSLASCGGDPAASAQPQESAQRASSGTSSLQRQAVASDYHDVVQKIYVGYFGRPADAGGLDYFAGRLLALGAPTSITSMGNAYDGSADVRAVIDVFGTSAESAALYPGDNGTFMEAVYRNLFGRAADPAGKAYWVSLLDAGSITRANAALNIMAGARNADIDIVNNKTAVARYFTGALATPLQQLAYNGLDANIGVRAMLGTVGQATNTVTFRTTVDAAIATLVKNLSAQGLYTGSLTNTGLPYHSLILENGQYWGMYSKASGARFSPSGLLQGSAVSDAGNFSSNDIRDFGPLVFNPGSIAAAFVPQSKLDGSLGTPNSTVAFASGASAALYNYSTPASLTDLEGSWELSDNDKRSYFLASPAAGLAAATSAACPFTSTFAPRASGKNVFDVTLNFGAGTCRLAGQAASGIAFLWLQDGGSTRQLLIAVTNGDRSKGAVLTGARVTADGIAPALSITDTVVGSGQAAAAGNVATMHYTLYLYNAKAPGFKGTRIQSSLDGGVPFTFRLGTGSVIAGWDQGVPGMRAGGKRTLVIPAALGYGASGSGDDILPNASLVFDVEMVSMK